MPVSATTSVVAWWADLNLSQVTAAGRDRDVLTLGASPPPAGCRPGRLDRGGVPGDWTAGAGGPSWAGLARATSGPKAWKESLPGQPHTV